MPTLRNKRTGETIFVPDQPSAPQGFPIGLQDPTMPYKAPGAVADINQSQASTARTNQQISQEGGLFDARKRQAEAEARLKEMQVAQAEAEARAKDPFNPAVMATVEADARRKLETIARIKQNIGGSWLPAVGTGAQTLAGIGGTGAANVAADTDTLRSGSALSEVLKMTMATGKNPFTPMSNSDVSLIANNTGNLSQTQDRENFMANLGNYENAYKRALAGAVGKRTLDSEIERLLPSIPENRREFFRQQAAKNYEERMSKPPQRPQSATTWYGTPRNAPRKSAGGAKFLGFED